MARIFISYSKKDRARLKPLEKALKAQGHLVWWDDRLRTDQVFKEIIVKHLSNAEAVIAIWTPQSVESKWVAAEARAAADSGKLLNIRYDAVESALLPEFVREMHVESMADWDEVNPRDPIFVKLNEAIGERKRLADKLRIRDSLGPTITMIDEKMGLSRILIDFGLPGGLRVYRLLAGAAAMTAMVWGLLFFVQTIDDFDGEGLEWAGVAQVFLFILVIRALHQMRGAIAAGEVESYIDRFFESDFAFCTVTSAMIGAIGGFAAVIYQPALTLFDVFNFGALVAGMALMTITVVRLVAAVGFALQRRID